MGLRGPAPRPPEVKALEGERKDRINTQAPQPVQGWPGAPVDLSADALAVWVRLKEAMAGTGHVRRPDEDTIKAYCNLVVRVDQLQAMYEQMGPLVEVRETCKGCEGCESGSGECPGFWVKSWRSNPIALRLEVAVTQLRNMAREIGATPASRSVVKDPSVGGGSAEPGRDFL